MLPIPECGGFTLRLLGGFDQAAGRVQPLEHLGNAGLRDCGIPISAAPHIWTVSLPSGGSMQSKWWNLFNIF